MLLLAVNVPEWSIGVLVVMLGGIVAWGIWRGRTDARVEHNADATQRTAASAMAAHETVAVHAVKLDHVQKIIDEHKAEDVAKFDGMRADVAGLTERLSLEIRETRHDLKNAIMAVKLDVANLDGRVSAMAKTN